MEKKSSKQTISGSYFNRTMSNQFETAVIEKFKWLIDYVKTDKYLDFQTGCTKGGQQWFSIYRGTSRILKLTLSRDKFKIDAADSYKKLLSKWFDEASLNIDSFKNYLSKINADKYFGKYYISGKKLKEGYFQNLISRRYTIGLKPDDEFVIVDKELVIGFESEQYKESWNSEIIKKQDNLINIAREKCSHLRMPQDIKPKYGEVDFFAIDRQGNFVIMELKQNDGQKTYLSPVQVNYYYLQLVKYLKENKEDFCNAIRDMFNQKVRMGLINEGWIFPNTMNCEIKTCLVIGNEKGISKETCERFKIFRSVFTPNMHTYMATSDNDGTLKECKILNS